MAIFTTSDHCPLTYDHISNTQNTPTIVLLHGWGGNRSFWSPLIEALCNQFPTLNIDLRGHGESGGGDNTASIPQLSQDIHELLTHLDIDNTIFVGWSMGAHVLLDYFERYSPPLLFGAVIVDMTPKVTTNSEWKLGLKQNFDLSLNEIIVPLMKDNWSEYVKSFADAVLARSSQNIELKQRFVDIAAQCAPNELIPIWESLCTQDFRHLLPSFTCPLLYVQGEESMLYNHEVGQFYIDNAPTAELLSIPKAGHSPHVEQPEIFNTEVLNFCKNISAK